jgi:sugar lactone lactonase YvrE
MKAAIAMFLVSAASMILPAASAPALETAATSQSMIWNAVAVEKGRVFVGGPRWSGSHGPALAVLDAKGLPHPFPSTRWNGWRRGGDPAQAFVNVNAIHRGTDGNLWVIDTGAPDFGGNPLPGAAKVVRLDADSGKVLRIYPLGPSAAPAGSYIDDIRIHGAHGYLTDAGNGALVVLDLKTGETRRVFEKSPFTRAPANRPIIVDGTLLNGPDSKPLAIASDPLELSPDGETLYFAPLEGPWHSIETRYLDDPAIDPSALAQKVKPWADIPPIGGSAMDKNGDLYFTDLAENALKRRSADGHIETVIQDKRLHWVDAPFIDDHHVIWLPVPQLDRVALFHGGASKIVWPVELLRLRLPTPR